MKNIVQSKIVSELSYEIRGNILDQVVKLEKAGEKVIRLNVGNPGMFDFQTTSSILTSVKDNLENAQPYSESQGHNSARQAIVEHYNQRGFENISTENIYLGNGVSELIIMSLQALLNNGDEVLIPTPDYPLWTAAVKLAGGKAVHYLCEEENDWNPSLEDISKKITSKTKAIVVINPNNPTGAVYSEDTLKKISTIARKFGLIILSDEIYDKIIYDNIKHKHIALFAPDLFCITFNGLSKSHMVAGYRSGWMLLSGNTECAAQYVEGLNVLASMRLCPNTIGQAIIPAALQHIEHIEKLTSPNGRLLEQRDLVWEEINKIPGISCVKPKGALYAFPKLDLKKYGITDDSKFALDLLQQKKVLIVQGSGFNWGTPDHFRIVFLPKMEQLKEAINRIAQFCENYHQ